MSDHQSGDGSTIPTPPAVPEPSPIARADVQRDRPTRGGLAPAIRVAQDLFREELSRGLRVWTAFGGCGAAYGTAFGALWGALWGMPSLEWAAPAGGAILGALMGAFGGAVTGIIGNCASGRLGWFLAGVLGSACPAVALCWVSRGFQEPTPGVGALLDAAATVILGGLLGMALGRSLRTGTSRIPGVEALVALIREEELHAPVAPSLGAPSEVTPSSAPGGRGDEAAPFLIDETASERVR